MIITLLGLMELGQQCEQKIIINVTEWIGTDCCGREREFRATCWYLKNNKKPKIVDQQHRQ